jgi:hypothetical protein
MNLAAKVTTGIVVIIVGGLVALAAPAVATIGQAVPRPAGDDGNVGETIEASSDAAGKGGPATPQPRDPKQAAAWAIGCDDFGLARGYGGSPQASYPRPDRGPSEYASGTVTLDSAGNVSTYTVAPGDSGMSIGERFCIDYVSLLAVNDAFPTLQPGQVLTINP